MSALLRDIRLQLIHELGVKMDDALETAKAESIRREGAHAAYANSARNVRSLAAQAEKERVEGKLNDNDYAIAIAWIKRSVAACDNLTSQAFTLVHSAKGAERQATAVVATLKQMYDLEEVKKQRESVPLPVPAPAPTPAAAEQPKAAEAPAKEEPAKRPHARPRTLKEARLAEAAARKAAEEAAAAEAAKKAAPKKRGRRARNA